MTSILPKLHESMAAKELQLCKRRASLRTHEAKLQALFADIEALGGEPHSDGDWIFVPVTGDKHKFLAFARLIAKHGFGAPRVEKGATGFTMLKLLGSGDSELPIYFQFSSTACRRVKVGTKTVEQDVYETVCDESLPYGEQSPQHPAESAVVDDLPF